MDQKTDAEIAARVLKGDKQAYALLINAHKGPIFNLAFRMTGSLFDAEDLTQEIFIRAYQKLHQFDQQKKYFTWLYTIAINLIRNNLKRKPADIKNYTNAQVSYKTNTLADEKGKEGLLSEENIKRLDESMRKLPVDLREAIILKYHQDLTFEEVADITDESVSAIKMRIYRGLEKLKNMMDEK